MNLNNRLAIVLKIKLPVLCLVCITTVLFGLWPLNFHSENQVHWFHNQNGIQFHKQGVSSRFSKRGIVYSPERLDILSGSSAYRPTTIEICVESKSETHHGLGYILSFYDGKSQEPLIVAQWISHLVIRSRTNRRDSRNQYREIGLRNALRVNRRSLITLASGKESTEIYVNGELAQSFPKASFIGLNHIDGQLVLGNSSTGANPWAGNLYVLAIYDRQLLPEQIQQNYKNWTQIEETQMEPQNNPVAFYSFDERDGSYVHNNVDDKNHLRIPSTFAFLKRNILVPFWDDFVFSRGLVADVVINVFGFIPFGYCLITYLMIIRQSHRGLAYLATILSGACLSLVIEITQICLPTRHSSLLDLVCNTLGAVLGVALLNVCLHVSRNRARK